MVGRREPVVPGHLRRHILGVRSMDRALRLPAALAVATLLFAQDVPPVPPGRGRGGRGGLAGFTQPEPIDFADTGGWKPLFDGKSLRGWDGNFDFWHVENGAIVAESTCE